MALTASPVLTLTAHLTEDEREIFEAFAAEHEIDDPADAFRAMLHELAQLHDTIWDMQFANSPQALKKLARETRAEMEAGLTEDFDPDDELRGL